MCRPGTRCSASVSRSHWWNRLRDGRGVRGESAALVHGAGELLEEQGSVVAAAPAQKQSDPAYPQIYGDMQCLAVCSSSHQSPQPTQHVSAGQVHLCYVSTAAALSVPLDPTVSLGKIWQSSHYAPMSLWLLVCLTHFWYLSRTNYHLSHGFRDHLKR